MDVRVEVKVTERVGTVECTIRGIVVYVKHVSEKAKDLLGVHWMRNRESFIHVEIILPFPRSRHISAIRRV
jgi:hypothetical protein